MNLKVQITWRIIIANYKIILLEIWFTEKDRQGATKLYSLADFIDEDGARVRKDESYEKNYLLGKYGAIPVLRHFDVYDEE